MTCNAINPGFVDTGMVTDSMALPAREKGITVEEACRESAAISPQNRMPEPEEIAPMRVFLCTDGVRGIMTEDIDVAMGRLW